MVHLPLREVNGKVDIAYPYQRCIQKARRHKQWADATKVISAVGGVFILTLIGFWTPSPELSTANPTSSAPIPWLTNTKIFLAVQITAAIISLTTTIGAVLNFEREASKYGTASRALRRLIDQYDLEVKKDADNVDYINRLNNWAREHIYKIESLLEDVRVFDVDLQFNISDPPS